MKINEAFLQAETKGSLITNNFFERMDIFLKYMGEGVFYAYKKNTDGTTTYKYEIREFSYAHILSNGWSIYDGKINPSKEDLA